MAGKINLLGAADQQSEEVNQMKEAKTPLLWARPQKEIISGRGSSEKERIWADRRRLGNTEGTGGKENTVLFCGQ